MSRLGLLSRQRVALKSRWRVEIEDHVISLAWSPDGRWLAAAAISGPITLFDAETGAPEQTLPGHDFGTTNVSWQAGAETGPCLASAGQDGKVRIWDIPGGRERFTLEGGAFLGGARCLEPLRRRAGFRCRTQIAPVECRGAASAGIPGASQHHLGYAVAPAKSSKC